MVFCWGITEIFVEYLARKFFATQGILADLYLLQVIPRPVDCEVLRGTHRDPKEYRDDYNQQYGNERNTALAMRGERPLYPGRSESRFAVLALARL